MWKNLLLLLLFVAPFNLKAQFTSKDISKSLLLGKLDYNENVDFVKVNDDHASKTTFLNKEVYDAFLKMYEKASSDGIELKIISGARNFEHQKAIWERKWQRLADIDPHSRTQQILEFSSMPSTSRHHWGTDIDLNNLENSYFESGQGKKEYDWLVKHAPEFGFYQVYTSKNSGRTGYSEEKWHWSYLPLANRYLQAYNSVVSYDDIEGFEGAFLAEEYKMISHYVNGVSEQFESLVSAEEISEEILNLSEDVKNLSR